MSQRCDVIQIYPRPFRNETNPDKGLRKLFKLCMIPKEQIEYFLVQVKSQSRPISFHIIYHDRKVMVKAQNNIAKLSKAGCIYTQFHHDQYYHGTPDGKVELRLS